MYINAVSAKGQPRKSQAYSAASKLCLFDVIDCLSLTLDGTFDSQYIRYVRQQALPLPKAAVAEQSQRPDSRRLSSRRTGTSRTTSPPSTQTLITTTNSSPSASSSSSTPPPTPIPISMPAATSTLNSSTGFPGFAAPWACWLSTV